MVRLGLRLRLVAGLVIYDLEPVDERAGMDTAVALESRVTSCRRL